MATITHRARFSNADRGGMSSLVDSPAASVTGSMRFLSSCRLVLANVDLVSDLLPDRSIVPVDAQNQRSVERVLLAHLDAHAGTKPELLEKDHDLGIGRSRHRH